MLYRMINKSSRFLNKNSQVARAISKIQWIYFLPFFVWIDRLIRVYDIPLASLWDEAYMLFLVLIIAYRRWFKDIKYYFTTIDRGIVFFGFIYLIITFLNSTDILIGLEGYRVVTQYILTFFIVVQLADTEKRIVNIIWLFMISIGLLGLHGVYQFATGAPMLGNWVDSGEDISTRAYSILGSPNALASILVLCLKRLILFFLSLASLAIFGLDQIYSRVYYLLTPEYLAKSARGGRMYRYAEALGQWSAEGKWFGLGVGRFGGAVATNHGLSPFYMDSFFLKTLAEAGLIGLISYVGLVLNTMVQSYKYILGTKNSQYRVVMYGLFAGMIGVLIHNVVENIFEIPYMVTYFWAMAALIVSLQREDSKKREVSNS
jgi:putative inorganic carbon (HCO3(-)) transporter